MKKCDYDPVIFNFTTELSKQQLSRLAKWTCGPAPVDGRRLHVPEIGRSESGPPFDLGAPVTGGAPR